MKVLLVSRELSPFYGGGIGTYIAEMARTLAARGHETHILTAPHESLHERAGPLFPGITLHTVDLEAGDAALSAYPTFPMRYSMAVLDALRALQPPHRFDLIEFPDYHAEGYFALRAKRTLGHFAESVLAVRLHSTTALCREADMDERLDVELAMIAHMEAAQVRESDLVLSPGERVLDRLAPSAAPDRPGAVVPLPLDVGTLVSTFGGAKSSYEAADVPNVLFFGKLQFLKGPQDLLRAAHLLAERGVRARFRFIGNDSPTGPFGRSMLDHLRRRTEPRLAEMVSFEPAVPRPALGPAIRDATVCCFPSRWEAFPMACLEAMAQGAPVIASDAGGLGEIVQHEVSGLLFPAGSEVQLADAIERALADVGLRARLGHAARDRVRTLCDPDRVVHALESAVSASRRAPRPTPAHPRGAAPAVSIIIPHYNLGPFLPETLASVRAQTFSDYETIVVDDGSTEPASLRVIASLPGDVRVIRQANRGLGGARNAGLHAARGRWIVPLDADDLIEPTLLEKLIRAADSDPGASYVSPLVAYFTDDPRTPTGGWVPLGIDPDLLAVLNVGGAASGTLIDREMALRVGGWDTWMTAYEDWEFWCRVAKAGGRGLIVPEFLLRYRVREASMFRTEVSRHHHLHAYLLSRHPELATPRAMRLLASRAIPDPRAELERMVQENFRYRIADRVNDALKKAGLQQAVKSIARRAGKQP